MELKDENYGVELCQAIGKAYKAKADQHQVRFHAVLASYSWNLADPHEASSQFAPLGWFHGAKSTFNTVSDT